MVESVSDFHPIIDFVNAVLDGTNLHIKVSASDPEYTTRTLGAFGRPRNLNLSTSSYIWTITVNGQTQTKSSRTANFDFVVERQKFVTFNTKLEGVFWWGVFVAPFGIVSEESIPYTLNLNSTVDNTNIMVTANDVAQAISNASYIQNVNGDRHFIWDINYSIKNLSSIPLGFKITFLIEFRNEAGQAGTVLQILKTLSTENGTFHFDIQNNSILTDNTMDLKVLMVSRDDNFAIANPALKRLTLIIDEPPSPVFISQNISITFTDTSIGGFNTSILISEVGELLAINNNRWVPTLLPTPLPENQPLTTLSQLINDINALLIVEPPPPPLPLPPTIPPQESGETCTDYRIRVASLGFIVDWIEPCQDVPNSSSYTMELKQASYAPTSEGKRVFVQIEATRIGVGVDSATSIINIRQGDTGIDILTKTQPLQIGGANIFPIVWDIADIGQVNGKPSGATATIDIKVILVHPDGFALTQFPLTVRLQFDSPPVIPPPTGMAKGSVMQKILGGLAMLGTTVLLSSKGR